MRKAASITAAALLDNVTELLLAFGLTLIAIGFAQCWRPGMYLVPGAVLVWIALPARVPLVERPPATRREET